MNSILVNPSIFKLAGHPLTQTRGPHGFDSWKIVDTGDHYLFYGIEDCGSWRQSVLISKVSKASLEGMIA